LEKFKRERLFFNIRCPKDRPGNRKKKDTLLYLLHRYLKIPQGKPSELNRVSHFFKKEGDYLKK
jgi:hypothetical protein